MDSGCVASLVAGLQSEAVLNLADWVIVKECEKPAWFGRLGNNRKQHQKTLEAR